MKLLEPKQIVTPKNENKYYYNGHKYDDLDSLKDTQLTDIVTGKYSNSQVNNFVYSLVDLNDPKNRNSDLIATSLDELKTKTIEHVQNNISHNTINDSPIMQVSQYQFDNNYTYNAHLSNQENVNEIMKTIQPVTIAQIPTLDTKNRMRLNQPISNDDGHAEDGSVPEYHLPYRSYSKGSVSYNPDSNFIIIDPNKGKQTKSSSQNVKNQLNEQFCRSFDVDHKQVYKNSLKGESCFSNLSQDVNHNYLYVVKTPKLDKKYFLKKVDALKFLYATYDFKAHFTQEVYETIQFGNNTFNNESEYLDFINRNTVEVH